MTNIVLDFGSRDDASIEIETYAKEYMFDYLSSIDSGLHLLRKAIDLGKGTRMVNIAINLKIQCQDFGDVVKNLTERKIYDLACAKRNGFEERLDVLVDELAVLVEDKKGFRDTFAVFN